MPRVGKTESIIAGSVSAMKRWTFLSSTMLRQTVRTNLGEDERSSNNIYIIDAIISMKRANEMHHNLIHEVMNMPSTKIIEHPDVFMRETRYDYHAFDYFIELRNHPDEEINYDSITGPMDDF